MLEIKDEHKSSYKEKRTSMLFTIDMHDPFTQLLMYLPQSKKLFGVGIQQDCFVVLLNKWHTTISRLEGLFQCWSRI